MNQKQRITHDVLQGRRKGRNHQPSWSHQDECLLPWCGRSRSSRIWRNADSSDRPDCGESQCGRSTIDSTVLSSSLSFFSIILPLRKMTSLEHPAIPHAENITSQTNHQEITFPLPRSLHTTAHIHFTFEETYAMVFLATTLPGDSGEKPLGSFVYAMPDVRRLYYLSTDLINLYPAHLLPFRSINHALSLPVQRRVRDTNRKDPSDANGKTGVCGEQYQLESTGVDGGGRDGRSAEDGGEHHGKI